MISWGGFKRQKEEEGWMDEEELGKKRMGAGVR